MTIEFENERFVKAGYHSVHNSTIEFKPTQNIVSIERILNDSLEKICTRTESGELVFHDYDFYLINPVDLTNAEDIMRVDFKSKAIIIDRIEERLRRTLPGIYEYGGCGNKWYINRIQSQPRYVLKVEFSDVHFDPDDHMIANVTFQMDKLLGSHLIWVCLANIDAFCGTFIPVYTRKIENQTGVLWNGSPMKTLDFMCRGMRLTGSDALSSQANFLKGLSQHISTSLLTFSCSAKDHTLVLDRHPTIISKRKLDEALSTTT